jgi:predicted MPP superfamily phosphohydrolase
MEWFGAGAEVSALHLVRRTWLHVDRRQPKPVQPFAACSGMKLLITADLHLVDSYRDQVLARLSSWIDTHQPDALLIAGDIAVPREAERALSALRALFAEKPVAAALGNHDFWSRDLDRKDGGSLQDVIDDYWSAPAARHEITLLDRENLALSDITICGGYGHYDLGFAVPGLSYFGHEVSLEDYLNGRPPAATQLRWRDFDRLPRGLNLLEAARAQISGVEHRIQQSNGLPLLVVLHTPPFEALLGLPEYVRVPGNDPPVIAFFRAYLGNRAMGDLLQKKRNRLCGIFCGHTHRGTDAIDFGDFRGINIGSDYGAPRACLFETTTLTLARIDDR